LTLLLNSAPCLQRLALGNHGLGHFFVYRRGSLLRVRCEFLVVLAHHAWAAPAGATPVCDVLRTLFEARRAAVEAGLARRAARIRLWRVLEVVLGHHRLPQLKGRVVGPAIHGVVVASLGKQKAYSTSEET